MQLTEYKLITETTLGKLNWEEINLCPTTRGRCPTLMKFLCCEFFYIFIQLYCSMQNSEMEAVKCIISGNVEEKGNHNTQLTNVS